MQRLISPALSSQDNDNNDAVTIITIFIQRLISPALPHMFALWPRCTKRWIDRIYREVGSARVRFIMMIMIIMTKIVPIIYMIYREVGSARVRERPVVMIIVAKKVTIMLLVTIKMVHGLNILGG